MLFYGASILLSVHLSFREHSGVFCFVPIFSNAIMNNYTSFCSCFWITWQFISVLTFFFFRNYQSVSHSNTLTSIPTGVLMIAPFLPMLVAFYFSQCCSKACERVTRVLDCSFLGFQLSMSFLATCVYFLEKMATQATQGLPVFRVALFIPCY